MFEKASRLKVRFNYKGVLTTEDLWDLSIQDLDSIYKTLKRQHKDAQEDSLLGNRTTKENIILDLQIDILKHIVEVKINEAKDREAAKERKEKKEKLLALIEEKEDSDLKSKSKEELLALLNSM